MVYSDSDEEDATPPPPPPQNVIRIPCGEFPGVWCRKDPDTFLDCRVVNLDVHGNEDETLTKQDKITLHNAIFRHLKMPPAVPKSEPSFSGNLPPPPFEDPWRMIAWSDLFKHRKLEKAHLAWQRLGWAVAHPRPHRPRASQQTGTASVASAAGAHEDTTEDTTEESTDSSTSTVEQMLSSIIGMQSLKNQIRNTIEQIEYEREQGDTPFWPANMAMKGNQGTSKTTTARKLGDLLFQIGALPGRDGKAVFIEVRPEDVPEHNASKFIKAKGEEAVGGILFIDEIYLYTKGALDAFFALNDKYNKRVVFAVAGYPDKIDKFFKSNAGITSRFSERLDFPDLTVDELMQVTDQKMQVTDQKLKREYFDEAARLEMRGVMKLLYNSKDPLNGRGVEKLVVPTVEQAYKVRIAALYKTDRAKHDALKGRWTAEDIAQAAQKVSQQCPQKEAHARAAETEAGPSEVVAGDAGPSETGGGVQAEASSSVAVTVDDSEEDLPLTSRQPASLSGTSSTRKRKHRESSSEVAAADATDAVQANPLLETALRVLYPTPNDAIHKFRANIFKALDESDDGDVRKGWKSLGNQEVRLQVLNPQKGNKVVHEMLKAAMLAVHGLDFGVEPYKACKGEQGGWRVEDPASR